MLDRPRRSSIHRLGARRVRHHGLRRLEPNSGLEAWADRQHGDPDVGRVVVSYGYVDDGLRPRDALDESGENPLAVYRRKHRRFREREVQGDGHGLAQRERPFRFDLEPVLKGVCDQPVVSAVRVVLPFSSRPVASTSTRLGASGGKVQPRDPEASVWPEQVAIRRDSERRV